MSTGHHILSVRTCTVIFITLLFFTLVTIIAPFFNFGIFNFPIAMLIATIKASLVVFYFMGLKFDSNENRVIFFSSLIFVAIFIVLSSSDVHFRKADAYVPQDDIHNVKIYPTESESQDHH